MLPTHLPSKTLGWMTVTSHWDGTALPSTMYCDQGKETEQRKGQGKGAPCNSRLGRRQTQFQFNEFSKAVQALAEFPPAGGCSLEQHGSPGRKEKQVSFMHTGPSLVCFLSVTPRTQKTSPFSYPQKIK